MMRTPLTMDDYLSSRWIVEPLRLFDCCLETDAAVALVVTTAERARDLRQPPVLIAACDRRRPHPVLEPPRRPRDQRRGRRRARACSRGGLGPADVDVAELYDAFTPLVLLQLEDYGFCKKGEAGRAGRVRARRDSAARCPSTPTAATCRRATSTA